MLEDITIKHVNTSDPARHALMHVTPSAVEKNDQLDGFFPPRSHETHPNNRGKTKTKSASPRRRRVNPCIYYMLNMI